MDPESAGNQQQGEVVLKGVYGWRTHPAGMAYGWEARSVFRCDSIFSSPNASNHVSAFSKLDNCCDNLGISLLFRFLRHDTSKIFVGSVVLRWALETMSARSQNQIDVEMTSASACCSNS